MRKLAVIFAILLPVVAAGQTKVQRYLDSLSRTEPFRSARLGVMAVKVNGDTVATLNHVQKITPASNVKLITTGLGLRELGSGYRFQTSIGYTGEIVDGVLKGDLYIVGGGDPSLGSKDSIATYLEGVFTKWKSFLSKAGIRRIDGRIIGDDRFFDGERENASWLYEDIGTYYGTGNSGLSFYRNKQDFKVSPGKAVGDPINIAPIFPETPWMKYSYNCSTGKAGTGDKLFLYTSDLNPTGEVRGTFAVDRQAKTVECSNKFPAYTCAFTFAKYLTNNNIASKGIAYTDYRGFIYPYPGEKSDETAGEPSILGSTLSPQLGRIAFIVNQRSDNFYAEAIYRALGKAKTGSASFDSCRVAEHRILEKMGLARGVNLFDGSGLSRKNGVSPEFFCLFLRAMLGHPVFESFVGTLTIPGEGSQVGRMRTESPGTRARIRYKSGSMEGVRCYSGYIIPSEGGKDDTIIFSVMLDSYDGPTWMATSRIDQIMGLLAAEN